MQRILGYLKNLAKIKIWSYYNFEKWVKFYIFKFDWNFVWKPDNDYK